MLQKLVPVAIAISALAAGAYYWQSSREPVEDETPVPIGDSSLVIESAAAPSSSTGTTAAEPETAAMQSPARRIQHGTAEEQEGQVALVALAPFLHLEISLTCPHRPLALFAA